MDGVSDTDPVDVKPVIIPLGESSTESEEEETDDNDEDKDEADLEGDNGSGEQGGNDPEKALDTHSAGDPDLDLDLDQDPDQDGEQPKSEFKCNYCTVTFKVTQMIV